MPANSKLTKLYRLAGIRGPIKNKKFFEEVKNECSNEIKLQDNYDLTDLQNADKAIIFLIPGNNKICGGIMSIYSLCEASRKFNKDSLCILSTFPNSKYTYSVNKTFPNNEKIYRFSQITKNCKNLQEAIVHIPEYYVKYFYKNLSEDDLHFFKSIKNLQFNILNQNIDLMPKPKKLKKLRKLTKNITQTIAHDRCATQQVCNKWGIPTHLMSVNIDVSKYKSYDFEEKEKIIVLSNDKNEHKLGIINKIKHEMPDFKLITVQNMTFSEYMDLIAKAYFTITFGEGMDGYFGQPHNVGSIGFAVYNDGFFPNNDWSNLLNVYKSYNDMYNNIVKDMKQLLNDKELYYKTVEIALKKQNSLYRIDKFEDNVKRFYRKEYDFYPKSYKTCYTKIEKKVINMIKKFSIKNLIEKFKLMHDKSLYIGIPDDLTLQLSFNNYCNCKCKFCFESIAKTKEERAVIPEKWLYDDLVTLYPKTANIVTTYGEITCCKEGYEFLNYIHKNYPHINNFIETNGITFDEKWAELASENLMRVHFSINAINEEYFKKTVWDKDGVYPVIQKNFNNYVSMLERKNLSAFKPSVSCVISSVNYDTIVEFVRQYVNKGTQVIVFYFETEENETLANNAAKSTAVEDALITLIELEKLLKGKVQLYFRLFSPTNNLNKYDDIVAQTKVEDLQRKYPDIYEITKDWDLKKLYLEKDKIRREKGKRAYSYYEEVTNVCYHQGNVCGNIICTNPWKNIRIRPNGAFDVCSWRSHRQNLKKYIKNNKIDFEAVFNSYFYRKLRKDFQKKRYNGCMPNCPGMENISVEEFNNEYDLNIVEKV